MDERNRIAEQLLDKQVFASDGGSGALAGHVMSHGPGRARGYSTAPRVYPSR